jgi:glycosyltransferase involved in cell wall biosynthesis
MKIVLVNKFWYPRGGAEKVALLTKELLEKAGHQVEIFGMNHPSNLFSNQYFTDFIDYHHASIWQKIKFGVRAIYNLQAARNFKKLLNDFQPEVVHFHNIYHQLSCSVIGVAKQMGIKTVMTLHDYKFISPNYNLYHHGQIDESCVGGKYYRCLLNNCLENYSESVLATLEAYFVDIVGYKKMIDQYISPSNFLRDKFIKAGFDAKKIVQLSNPLSPDNFVFTKNDGDYVAYVGRLAVEKGVNFLLQAAHNLPTIHFKIAGDGPQKEYLHDLTKNLNLKNIEFAGEQRDTDLQKLIGNARLLVAPSVWYENAPLSIMEAKAHGKIVIASDLGGISELLPKECLVVPAKADILAKKIEYWFLASSQDRQNIGEELYRQALDKNSVGIYLQRLLTIYAGLQNKK